MIYHCFGLFVSLQDNVLSYVDEHLLVLTSYKQNEVFVNYKQAILLKPKELHGSVGTTTT